MLHFKLSRDSPLNTKVIDTNGHVIYVVSSSSAWSLRKRRTTITRPASLGNGGSHGEVEVAKLKWNVMNPKFVYGGQKQSFKEFMPTTGFLRSSRKFQGPDGHTYVWKKDGTSCRLTRKGHKHKIAETKHHMLRKTSFDIDEDAMHMFDIILITWIYFERKRKEEEADGAGDAGDS